MGKTGKPAFVLVMNILSFYTVHVERAIMNRYNELAFLIATISLKKLHHGVTAHQLFSGKISAVEAYVFVESSFLYGDICNFEISRVLYNYILLHRLLILQIIILNTVLLCVCVCVCMCGCVYFCVTFSNFLYNVIYGKRVYLSYDMFY